MITRRRSVNSGRKYYREVSPLRHTTPSVKFLALGVLLAICGFALLVGFKSLAFISNMPILGTLVSLVGRAAIAFLVVSVVALVAAVILHFCISDATRIRYMVNRALYDPAYGNPLHLQDRELLPRLRCVQDAPGVFKLTISVRGCTAECIEDVVSSISAALTGRFKEFAVNTVETGISGNEVTFMIGNVVEDKTLRFPLIETMNPADPTKLAVQEGTNIDLTTSGSILVAGKTRSGKTTGIVTILLQVLLSIYTRCNGRVVIIDPKNAELGQLPHVAVPDEDGEVTGILNRIKEFWDLTTSRQKILSEKSKQTGDAVKWWDADMRASFLVIDEYISLRSMFPTKAEKGSDYCLATFDALIKRLVTMGASAGCFVIISIAEASVESGGLPAMLRSAMSTKILFKPTLPEARLMWDSEKLKAFSTDRVYKPGDAWFSSTDGVHDNVSFVHFPEPDFPIYRELGFLLRECYAREKKNAPPFRLEDAYPLSQYIEDEPFYIREFEKMNPSASPSDFKCTYPLSQFIRELDETNLNAECHEATRMAPPPPCEAEAEAGAGDIP